MSVGTLLARDNSSQSTPAFLLVPPIHRPGDMLSLRRRSISRLLFFAALLFFVYVFFFSSSSSSLDAAKRKRKGRGDYQIKEHNFIERATRPDKSLNVQHYPFLQARIGRDERDDIFNELIYNGQQDYWERFQMP